MSTAYYRCDDGVCGRCAACCTRRHDRLNGNGRQRRSDDFRDYDPSDAATTFWDAHEYGPEPNEAEIAERVAIAEHLLTTWQTLRTLGDRPHRLTANAACGHLVVAFGQTVKLRWRPAIVLMDEIATLHPEGIRRRLLDEVRANLKPRAVAA